MARFGERFWDLDGPTLDRCLLDTEVDQEWPREYSHCIIPFSVLSERRVGMLMELSPPPRFDLVIVDTPPTRNALDFLDAPGTLAKFIDHPLFRLLMMPTRRGMKVLNVAAQPVLRTIGRVVGGDVLADAVAFFQAFSGMETGFRQRADEVMELLRSDVTRFVLVASPFVAWLVYRLLEQPLLRMGQTRVRALVTMMRTRAEG